MIGWIDFQVRVSASTLDLILFISNQFPVVKFYFYIYQIGTPSFVEKQSRGLLVEFYQQLIFNQIAPDIFQ